MRYLVIALALCGYLGKAAEAADVFWVELQPWYSYQELGFACGDNTGGGLIGDMFVMGIVNDAGQVVHAEFRSTNTTKYTRTYVFTADDVAAMKVQKNPVGDYYITNLRMNAAALGWFIYNLDVSNWCVPHVALHTISPGSGNYEFKYTTSSSYFAPVQRFSGTRIDGQEYQVRLGFWQKMLMEP